MIIWVLSYVNIVKKLLSTMSMRKWKSCMHLAATVPPAKKVNN